MRIIAASVSHIDWIRSIAQRTWPHTFGQILSPEQIVYMLDLMYSHDALTLQIVQKKHQFVLLEHEAVFHGYASYELNHGQQGYTKIHKIYVLPVAQGKKYGLTLMQHIEKIARVQHQKYLVLNVNRYNAAVNFYKQYGFRIMGEENIDIGHGYLMEDYIMQKDI